MIKRLSIQIILLVMACGVSVPAWSTYASQDDLFQDFQKAEIHEVIRVKHTQEVQFHKIYPDTQFKSVNLKPKKGRVRRVAALDYFYGVRGLYGKSVAHAYKVENVFLCYVKNKWVAGGRLVPDGAMTGSFNYSDCYLFPHNVNEVIKALKEVKS